MNGFIIVTCFVVINLSWNADTNRSNGCRTKTNLKRFDNFEKSSGFVTFTENVDHMCPCSLIDFNICLTSPTGMRFMSAKVVIHTLEATFGTWQYANISLCSVISVVPGYWIQWRCNIISEIKLQLMLRIVMIIKTTLKGHISLICDCWWWLLGYYSSFYTYYSKIALG